MQIHERLGHRGIILSQTSAALGGVAARRPGPASAYDHSTGHTRSRAAILLPIRITYWLFLNQWPSLFITIRSETTKTLWPEGVGMGCV